MRRLILILSILLLSTVPVLSQAGTVADIAASNPDFSILLAAADAAGYTGRLTGSGPVTVFAPTNGAFGTLLGQLGLNADQLLADTALLELVVGYHIVPSQVTMGNVIDSGEVSVRTLSGNTLTAAFVNNRISLNNGQATVTQPNLFGSNGVVHVIDNVLLPPGAAPSAPAPAPAEAIAAVPAPAVNAERTITNITGSAGDLSLLYAALVASGLNEDLNSGGPYTLLAPTNGAFGTLLGELNLTQEGLLADPALLRRVLTYHVIPQRLTAGDLQRLGAGSLGPILNGSRLPPVVGSLQQVGTLNGKHLPVAIDNGQVILDGGRAAVISPDILATNGVIHIINNVLLP